MTKEVQLVNEDGVLVGRDPETGEKVPVEIDEAVVNNLESESHGTEQATIGPVTGAVTGINWDRPELLNSDTTVQVPQDEPTIQDALREVPRRLNADYVISIDPGQNPYDEDIVIPPVQSEDKHSSTQGANSRLEIESQTNGTAVQVNSVFGLGGRGAVATKLRDIDVDGVTPHDEDAGYIFYGGGSVTVANCGVTGSSRVDGSTAFVSYASSVKLEGTIDWGTDLFYNGTEVKHGGFLMVDNTVTANGSVRNLAHSGKSGKIDHAGIGPTAGNRFADDQRRNRAVVDHRVSVVDHNGTREDLLEISSGDGVTLSTSKVGEIAMTSSGYILVKDDSGNSILQFRPDGDIQMLQDGTGIRATSPDGTVEKTFGVLNDGTWGELP